MKAIIHPTIKIIFALGILVTAILPQNSMAQTAPSISCPDGTFIYALGDTINPIVVNNSGGAVATSGLTSTFAGTGLPGQGNSTGIYASFNQPVGIVMDASRNLYIADAGNELIRKITPAGVVSTFAGAGTNGTADGTGTSAYFYHPAGMCIDASGNIYIADQSNNMIRKMTLAGVVTTIGGQPTAGYTDGPSSTALFNLPSGVAVDASGNVYVADYNNNVIRKIAVNGTVSTFAGNASGTAGSSDGTGTSASFNHPFGLAIDAYGDLYVADRLNNMIRKITPAGVVTTIAGQPTAGYTNATGAAAQFNNPTGVTVDGRGDILVADEFNNCIRRVNYLGAVTTLSGQAGSGATNGIGTVAKFNNPFAIMSDVVGHAFLCDLANNDIREVIYGPFSLSWQLPAGLSFNLTTGQISGTPTVMNASSIFTITAYNTSGTSSKAINIAVNAADMNFSQFQNCVVTYTPRIAGITTSTGLKSASNTNTSVETNIQYLDGLGRPLQTVQFRGSPTNKDVVQPFTYDQLGRDSVEYGPYSVAAASPGRYEATAITAAAGYTGSDQYQFYQTSGAGYAPTQYPYAGTNYEPSPLNRLVEKGAEGAAWQLSNSGVSGSGHTVKVAYLLNNSTAFAADSVNGMQVASYTATANSNFTRTLVSNGFYAPATLTVTVTKDENWTGSRAGTTEEYKDNLGRVVLKRVYDWSSAAQPVLSTYYVYDEFGKLAFVLPPASGADAGTTITPTSLNNLCYQYMYDQKGRLVQKKIPGKGWEYIAYNAIDQPVATQDAVQQGNNQWVVTKYDELDRPVMTGVWNNGGATITRSALQSTLSGIITNLHETVQNSGNGYTNVAWPTSNITQTLVLTYYDSYQNIPGLPSSYLLTSGISTNTRSLPTVKVTSVLNTPTDQLWDVIYFDDLGRPTTTYGQHYFQGAANTGNYDLTTITYNFTNQPTTSNRQHWNLNSIAYPAVTIYNKYLYDQMGRKTKTWEQITNGNNAPDGMRLISQVTFDEIGQLRYKKLHSADSVNYLQTVSYTYNERSWLLSANAPLFAMSLYYNSSTQTNQAYNGNITYQYWGTPGNLSNHYTYTYDKLNRLTGGATSADNYQESGISYDVMGNIKALTRYQHGTLIDQLGYTYTTGTNVLQSVYDGSGNNTGLGNGTTNYTYDLNGNMLSATDTAYINANKTFTYNLLNLPLNATYYSGTTPGTATYIYDAAGNKLRKVTTVGSNTTYTDYVNGIEYDGSSAQPETISFVQTEEGRAIPSGGANNYEYYLGDNLGNTRVTFDTQSGSAVMQQQDDYYPFGMDINRTNGSPQNKYLYNKKELQPELGEYDYGARFYDPVIIRFTSIDRFAEKYRKESPYEYVLDNPVRYIDIHGDSVDMAKILAYDKENNTDFAGKIVKDLTVETGLHVSIDGKSRLTYEKDKNGHEIIDKDKNGKLMGSATARGIIKGAIDYSQTAQASISNGTSGSFTGGLEFHVSPSQIQDFMNGANNVDPRTMGFGMTFMHELMHSRAGGPLDDKGSGMFGPGDIETKLNKVREELNQNGFDFGTRLTYRGYPVDENTKSVFIPFDENALKSLRDDQVEPDKSSKYVSYPKKP